MQPSEKELEQLIRSVPSIGPYHAGAGEAARLIAEKVAEGVVPLRQHVAEWYEEKGFDSSVQTLALGLMEEVGELAQAILLTECDDFKPSRHKQDGLLGDIERHKDVALEVGDILIYLAAICNVLDIHPKVKRLGNVTVTVTKEE